MPFTPSILEERQDKYFINPKNVNPHFMSTTFESTNLARKDLKAAVHPADFTIKSQVISEKNNLEFYDFVK